MKYRYFRYLASLAIALLFTLAGLAAVAVVGQSLRRAWNAVGPRSSHGATSGCATESRAR